MPRRKQGEEKENTFKKLKGGRQLRMPIIKQNRETRMYI
jgi:hypothetical protein